ncbi:hypothetical protein [Arcobacter roscoffensis]|uniref:Uncharacterized protein n=1 Tax=Arcobacter roscoffensis TaxID=2961520 RepID=A0ABY5E926_9BACT|nr:hypothetical protein [Arcobacter roscoffensis]UTJ07223.1 hypothetical protein NJU99_03800 [Arcobacter roscoffensis]
MKNRTRIISCFIFLNLCLFYFQIQQKNDIINKKGFVILKVISYLVFSTLLFANNNSDFSSEFKKLKEEKQALIDRYEIRVEVARLDKMYKRVRLLSKTLTCFKNTRSKREIVQCKNDERKRIMEIIRKNS